MNLNHKIVIALTETIRIMNEIDEVIETHGGWPGAFAVTETSAPHEYDMENSPQLSMVAEPKDG